VWRPLAGVIEERWRARFGVDDIHALRTSLQTVVGHLDVELPQYLPVTYPTQNGKADIPRRREPASSAAHVGGMLPLDLSVLLSQVLLAFTIYFERHAKISLPISANNMSGAFLGRHGCAEVEPDPATSRGKQVRLSPKGQEAQDKYRRILGGTEVHWGTLFGASAIHTLREPLERLVGDRLQLRLSPLFQGLEPYPDGWRASVRKPDTLPHCPMVLHRGRCPDGSQLNLGRVRRRPGGRPAHRSDVRVRWSAHRRPTAPHQSCRRTRRRR